MPFSGSVSRGLTGHRSVSGVLDFSGEASSPTLLDELLEGAFDFAGSLTRKLAAHRSLAGAVDTSGDVARQGTFHRSTAGPLDFEGSGLDNISHGFFETIAGILGGWVGAVASEKNKVVLGRMVEIIGSSFRKLIGG